MQEGAILYHTTASPSPSRELREVFVACCCWFPQQSCPTLSLPCEACSAYLSNSKLSLLHLFREHSWRNMTNATTPLVNVAIFCASSHLLNLSHIKLHHTLNHYICTPQSINRIVLHPWEKIYYINSIANIIIKDKKIKKHMSIIANRLKLSRPGLFNIRWTTYVILNNFRGHI